MTGKGKSETAILYEDLTYAVIGCAQRVHRALGPGFPESVYQKAMGHELMKTGIPFHSQARFEVAYDGVLCGEFRVDLCVDEKVIVELKAAESLARQHEAQTLAYLKAADLRLALLVNFGEPSLKVRRFAN